METFNATAHREGEWWVIEMPELRQTTQARTIAEIETMATDLAAITLDVDPSTIKVNVTVKPPDLPEATQ